MSWFDYFHQGAKHWQGLFGSLVGFGGVMITLSFNARLTRRARREELLSKQQALRTVLQLEIRRHRDAANVTTQMIAMPHLSTFAVDVAPITELYDRHLHEILVLSRDEIEGVVRAYNVVRKTAESFLVLPNTGTVSGTYQLDRAMFGHLVSIALQQVISDTGAAVAVLEAAIAASLPSRPRQAQTHR